MGVLQCQLQVAAIKDFWLKNMHKHFDDKTIIGTTGSCESLLTNFKLQIILAPIFFLQGLILNLYFFIINWQKLRNQNTKKYKQTSKYIAES